jgi:thiaminase/transcriptional activator TenA
MKWCLHLGVVSWRVGRRTWGALRFVEQSAEFLAGSRALARATTRGNLTGIARRGEQEVAVQTVLVGGAVPLTRLSEQLQALGEPLLAEQLAHPFLRGIADGSLDPDVFRAWLEQDFLFLHSYTRVFSRLAWRAPAAHLGDLVTLAHSTFHEELALHRELAAPFGADLDGAVPSPQCAAYTAFLLDAAAEHATGLAALLPCMWGYSQLGRRLSESTATGRYRRWVDTYADPAFEALARRCARMLDEAAPDPARARAAFLAGMSHELAFWDAR